MVGGWTVTGGISRGDNVVPCMHGVYPNIPRCQTIAQSECVMLRQEEGNEEAMHVWLMFAVCLSA